MNHLKITDIRFLKVVAFLHVLPLDFIFCVSSRLFLLRNVPQPYRLPCIFIYTLFNWKWNWS